MLKSFITNIFQNMIFCAQQKTMQVWNNLEGE